jgi:hypothetical protein
MTDPSIHDTTTSAAPAPTDAIRDAHDNLKAGIEELKNECLIPGKVHKAMHALSYAVKATALPRSEDMPNWLREAFDGDSIPKKNIALRMAFDEIQRIRSQAADAKAEPLREVRNDLRKLAIAQHERQASGGLFIKNGRSCRICKGAWTDNGPEFHTLTCTAVPLKDAIAASPPAVDRAALAQAIRKALIENWREDLGAKWDEDVLLTGCRKVGGGRGYQNAEEAAQNLALDAADAVIKLLPTDVDRAAVIEECAKVAEGPIYKERYRGHEGHNWWHNKQPGSDADQYGNGHHDAAADIRALADHQPKEKK